MRINLITILLLYFVAFSACQTQQNPEPQPEDKPTESVDSGKPVNNPAGSGGIGESFELGEGESLWVDGDRFQITVEKVISDSRCPEGANCFWEGNVQVQVTVGEDEIVLTLGGLREGDQNAVPLGDGLQIRVVGVDPYPGSVQEGQPYQITLVVERETSQPYNYPVSV